MRIKLYLDEDSMRRAFLNELRSRGVDVTTANEQNKIGITDVDQLDFAHSLGRVIFTFNAHGFEFLHHSYVIANKEHSGIIISHQKKFDLHKYTRAILNLINNKSAIEIKNTIKYLEFWT